MQGRLWKRSLSVGITTECAHCARPIELELDSRMRCRVKSEGARPLVSVPFVNLKKLRDPSIIHAF